jgi:hypothetical protein
MPAAKPTKKTPSFKRSKRLSHGFAQTGSILSKQIRKTSETRGFSETRLLTHWAEIAGPSIAKIAHPVKVGYTRHGMGATLTLLTTGANAPMVQMQLPQIKERVNATYGYAAISRLHLTQTASTGFTKEQAKLDVKQPMKRRIAPIKKAELKSNISNVSDEGLRTALAMLGENILTKLQK